MPIVLPDDDAFEQFYNNDFHGSLLEYIFSLILSTSFIMYIYTQISLMSEKFFFFFLLKWKRKEMILEFFFGI